MNALTLKLEPTQCASLHSTLISTLRAAAFSADLDAAQSFLERKCYSPHWRVYRGGSHVALLKVSIYGDVRVAWIAETADPYEVFEYADTRSEMRRAEEKARARDRFLKDAPAGSSNLHAAILEEAIRAIGVQVLSDFRGTSVTTGMANATKAALAIVEGVR